jgi:hypothetical protein
MAARHTSAALRGLQARQNVVDDLASGRHVEMDHHVGLGDDVETSLSLVGRVRLICAKLTRCRIFIFAGAVSAIIAIEKRLRQRNGRV